MAKKKPYKNQDVIMKRMDMQERDFFEKTNSLNVDENDINEFDINTNSAYRDIYDFIRTWDFETICKNLIKFDGQDAGDDLLHFCFNDKNEAQVHIIKQDYTKQPYDINEHTVSAEEFLQIVRLVLKEKVGSAPKNLNIYNALYLELKTKLIQIEH